jgi:AraC family transcriptional regulator
MHCRKYGDGFIPNGFHRPDYEQIEGPEILWNEHKDVTSPSFKSEIWIPISKKEYI